MTTLSKFQLFVTIFAHSTTPIHEVCLEPLSPSSGHGVKSTFLLGQPDRLRFCYTRSRSVETRSSSNIVLSCLHFFPILLNLMQKIDYFVPILGCFWPYLARLKPVFRIKFNNIGKLQNLNRKIIELLQVSTERLRVQQNLNSCGSASLEVLFAPSPQLGDNGSTHTPLIGVAE